VRISPRFLFESPPFQISPPSNLLGSKYKAIVKNVKSTIGHQAFASLTILTVLLTALSVILSHCGFVFIVSLIEISFLKTALNSLLCRANLIQHTKGETCFVFYLFWIKTGKRHFLIVFFLLLYYLGDLFSVINFTHDPPF